MVGAGEAGCVATGGVAALGDGLAFGASWRIGGAREALLDAMDAFGWVGSEGLGTAMLDVRLVQEGIGPAVDFFIDFSAFFQLGPIFELLLML